MCQRIGTKLELDDFGLCSFTAFDVMCRSSGVGRPHSLALPTAVRIINASIQTFGVKAHRVWNTKGDKFSVHERLERIGCIACGKRHVSTQAKCVVLIHPSVVARLS